MANPFDNVPLLPAQKLREERDANGVTRRLCSDGKWRIVPKPCPASYVRMSICTAELPPGWCLACGRATEEPVEPDTRKDQCDHCDLFQVYGAEECAQMGYLDHKR